MSRLYATGYLGDFDHLQLVPAPLKPDSSAAETRVDRLCGGGFGRWGFIAGGVLQTNCTDSLQQLQGSTAAFGWAHAIVIHRDGTVFQFIQTETLSANQHLRSVSPWETRRVEVDKPCRDVAAGEQHSLAVTDDGEIHSWGSNGSGQLGTADRQSHEQPQKLLLPSLHSSPEAPLQLHTVSQVACGARHSCAVTQSGALFCWGWNLHGQCGTGAVSDSVLQPHMVHMPQHLQCVSVAAGLGHTVACFHDGSAYSWGLNTDGQLGLGDDTARSTPHLLEAAVLEDLDVLQVACGARHTAFRTACGRAFVCGWGKWGQLGLGDRDSRQQPQLLPFKDDETIVEIAGGWWHTMFSVVTAGGKD